MRTLSYLLEGILSGPDADIEEYVEMKQHIERDLQWVQKIKLDDAVFLEGALFNCMRNAFIAASKKHLTPDELKVLQYIMVYAVSPFGCYNYDECDDWEQREYGDNDSRAYNAEYYTNFVNASIDDPRWGWSGSNSFYMFFFEPDYNHSIDQEELLVHRKTQQYSKQIIKTARKYGLNLNPIF